MHFHKYHGLGNDYIVIDPAHCSFPVNERSVQLICDRNFGIGSDGILYGPLMENGGMRVRIFNPDGSEAEKSGNGVRIFSCYLLDNGYVSCDRFSLITDGGTVDVTVIDRKNNILRVNMGTVTFLSSEIPVAGHERNVIDESVMFGNTAYRVTCLSVGNPHCVVPVEKATKGQAMQLGPVVENHSLFPNRINMQLLEIIDRNSIKIEIWERGAGYTLASGSSSCAAACAAHRLGMVDERVTVVMPGGTLQIEIDNDRVYMVGDVASIAMGDFTPAFLEQLGKL